MKLSIPIRPPRARTVEKPGRTDMLSLRLDPKLRFAAVLAAAIEHRSVSGFIEAAIEQAIKQVDVPQPDAEPGEKAGLTLEQLVHEVWDVDEADRFLKLAFKYPHLLSLTEQRLYKLVRENDYLWRSEARTGRNSLEDVHLPRLRKHWDTFKRVVLDELPESALPSGEAGSKDDTD
jgi:hypothetical protein